MGRTISAEKLESLREDLISQAPHLLIVSGDITDRGSTSQFRRAKAFLESVGAPFITVPGNREVSFGAVWEWLFPPLSMRRYSSYFGAKDRVLFVSDEHKVVLFGLNSVHALPSWPGSIPRATRYWFREKSAGFQGYFKALFLHHPVLPVIRSSSFWAHTLSDAGEMLNICSQNRVRLIMQGHKHRSAVMEVHIPERNARVVVSSCGAPLMPFWDSIYHIVEIRSQTVVVRPREFLGGTYVQTGCYEFPDEFNSAHCSSDKQER